MAQSGTVGTVAGPGGSAWTPAGIEFATKRGLSLATLEALGVREGIADFRTGPHRALIFPHYRDDAECGWKARAIESKEFTSQRGGEYRFWNLEQVLGSSCVYIVEGELDACALVEAGVPQEQVISVPQGANDEPAKDIESSFAYVYQALDEGLGSAGKFVLCTDSDKPGRVLREDLVRILGTSRCWFVDWPGECNDANETLLAEGQEALFSLVTANHQPWPVTGIYQMADLPEPPALTVWKPGFVEWESKVMLAPRTVSVVTGHPGHGKTTLFMQIWHNIAREYGIRVAVASFETRAKPHHRANLRRFHDGMMADDFIQEHFRWLQHEDDMPTLDWLLDRAEVAVIRHGCRVIQLDPWNALESSRSRHESETEYVARCLRNLRRFSVDMNCHIQIVAHPSKMEHGRRGQAPMLEDIAGSKAWDSMVDQGFVVHRPKVWDEKTQTRKTDAKMIVRKVRFSPELGYPCTLHVNYNLETGRYESSDYATI